MADREQQRALGFEHAVQRVRAGVDARCEVAEFVRGLALENGMIVPSTEPTAAPGAAPAPDPSTVTVQVVNATDQDGLAQSVAQVLAGAGYVGGGALSDLGGAYTSHVSAASAGDAGAFAVADALGGLPVQVDPAVPAGTVKVVLAEDYTGPTEELGDTGYTGQGAGGWETTTSVAPLPPSIAERPTFDAGDGSVPCVN